MRLTRAEVIDSNEINIVHVYNRTVRRCFLMGHDQVSGKNFDHRKVWIEKYLQQFAASFGIDLLCFTILSNHFHLILRTRPDVVETWDDTEVARRWMMICPHRKRDDGTPLPPSEAELNLIRNCPIRLATIRSRLSSASWWMRLLTQRIAQRANQEDDEQGHFFEGRFKATRLIDESSILACAMYVDLNQIRAGMAETIEQSEYSSIKRRIDAERQRAKEEQPDRESLRRELDAMLAPLSIDEQHDPLGPCPSKTCDRCSDKGFLGISTSDYFQLLDWIARQSVSGKRGKTPEGTVPIIQRLGLTPTAWTELVSNFGRLFHHVAGHPQQIDALRSHRTGRRFRVRPRVRELMPVDD